MGIQHYFIDKKIKGVKDKHLKRAISLSKIDKVLLFVDENTSFDQNKFKDLQKLMGLTDSHFEFLTYKGKKSNFNEFRGAIFSPDSLNWQAKITSESLIKTLAETYDLLIDYTQVDLHIKKLVIPKIRAAFKVGFSEQNEELYDFMIAVASTEINTFNKELVRYLRILKLI